MKKLHYLILPLILTIFFIACKTTQSTLKKDTPSFSNNVVKFKNYGIGKLIDSITLHYLNFDTLSIKFKISVDFSDESHNLDGVYRIKKDSLIWISLTAPLGIEAARILLTQDSIYFLNKLKKEYFIKPYSFFENSYKVELEFKDLQAILTNQLFLFSETDEEKNLEMNPNSNERDYIKKTFFKDKDSVNYILKTHRKHKIKRSIRRNAKELIVENIKITPKTFKISNIEILDYIDNRQLQINYNQFEPINNQLFPQTVDFILKDSLKTFQVKLEYTKITVNGETNFSFNIPKSYNRLP
ncbi:MAG: DUF4292 domain-containing protein [Bacteroidales bacterium]|nr:DUF4292 domain-containing protein [Bacteroidales bacterium]